MRTLALVAAFLAPIAAQAEPFHSDTPVRGPLADKWHHASKAIAADLARINRCHNGAKCSIAEAHVISIASSARSYHGLARFGFVNRSVNLLIEPTDDAIDQWSSPLDTMRDLKGDCEDYAIVKLATLYATGVPLSDMRLVIARDYRLREDHAVLAARFDDRWYILDNKHHVLVEDRQLTGLLPVASFALDVSSVR